MKKLIPSTFDASSYCFRGSSDCLSIAVNKPPRPQFPELSIKKKKRY